MMTNPDNPAPKITVIICTLNEEESLPHVLPKIPQWVDEVLLVDGHSTDDTVELAKKLRPDVHIIYQPGKGKGDALKHGIKHASGDIIVTLDADGATDPEEMPKFIKPLLNGYDFAKGSRFIRGKVKNKPRHRVLGNLIIALTFDLLFFKTYTDLCSGYNSFWKKAMEKVNIDSPDGFENEPLITARVVKTGLKVKEVGHADRGRIKGYSKAPAWRDGFRDIKTIIRERFRG
jgi:glycosyltransferase involved in cell wall biosynthesis